MWVPNLLCLERFSAQHFNPTIFDNIGKAVNQKLRALETHVSQIEKISIEYLNMVDIAFSHPFLRYPEPVYLCRVRFTPICHLIDF